MMGNQVIGGVLIAILLWVGTPLFAEDAKSGVSTAEIEEKIKKLSAESDASEESQKVIEAYKRALDFSRQTQDAEASKDDFREKTDAIPGLLEQMSLRNGEEPSNTAKPPSPKGTLEEVSRQAEIVKAELGEARAASQAHQDEGKARLARQAALPGIIAKAGGDLAALHDLEAPPASASELVRAEYQANLAKRELLRMQTLQHEAELRYLEASPGVFSAESAVLARQIASLTQTSEIFQRKVDQLRQTAASDEVERARQDLNSVAGNPKEEKIAQENLELAERHGGQNGLSQKMSKAAGDLSKMQATMDRVSKQFSSASRRVRLLEKVNLSIDPATGRLLRSQRQTLPSEASLREQLRQTVANSAQAQIDLMVLEDRQAELLAITAPSEEDNSELNRLWHARLDGLMTLIDDHRAYIKTLSSMTSAIRALIEKSSAFALFVDERLLWIPSTEPIRWNEFSVEASAVHALFASNPFGALYQDLLDNPWAWLLAGCVVAFLVIRRRKIRLRFVETSSIASKRNCTSFTPTVLALVQTLKLAAPIPLIVWFLYLRSGDCSIGVQHGLRNVTGFLSCTILLRSLAVPEGLMAKHFRMRSSRCELLRKELNWFIPTMPVFLFFAVALAEPSAASSSGRLSLMGVLVILIVFCQRLLIPRKGLVHWQGKSRKGLAKVCHFLGIAVPFALIVGAAVGYYESVQELRIQALVSVGMILATLFVAALLYRWILVSRRRFAVDQALKRRAAALAEKDAKESELGEKPQNVASLAEVKANALKVVEVEEQTSRLVRAAALAVIAFGLWGVWKPAVPALSALDRVTVWEEKGSSQVADSNDASGSSPSTPLAALTPQSTKTDDVEVTPKDIISLQDMITAVILLVLTFVAARNIPGLLELMIFRHLSLKPGSSFAFTTTIRYLIVVCGLVMAFGHIGITWGKVQWIAAAITLGIGFGLQEIFANFVAGLIILFERPIRLGDIVTIAGVDGKVTQIQIRATTIRQFNSRELIVPNKEFITGQLVNWTLSDNILRIDVPVGIAYGSDTELARDLLLKAAHDNSRVLDDPESMALFDNFADSSLAFILRVHVGSIDDMLPAKNELHFAIDHAFRDAGIEIAFPQSDIHIRSLPLALEKRNSEEAGDTEI